MPIPSPKSGEKENDFVSRCISSIRDEYGEKQSAAICYNTFRAKKSEDNIQKAIECLNAVIGVVEKKDLMDKYSHELGKDLAYACGDHVHKYCQMREDGVSAEKSSSIIRSYMERENKSLKVFREIERLASKLL